LLERTGRFLYTPFWRFEVSQASSPLIFSNQVAIHLSSCCKISIFRIFEKLYYFLLYYFWQAIVLIRKSAKIRFIGKGEVESSILSGSTSKIKAA